MSQYLVKEFTYAARKGNIDREIWVPPFLWIRIDFSRHQPAGDSWDESRILENRVARNRCVLGKFLQMVVSYASIPGED